MAGFLGDWYLWVKAGHVLFAFFWIAGLFTLPRYLVHQAGESPGSEQDGRWAERTKKLRAMILTPSLILVWLLGLLLAMNLGFQGGWLHAKIAVVLLLTGYHGWMVSLSKRMAAGARPMTERKLRLWNELPALLLAIIVVLVIVRPF